MSDTTCTRPSEKPVFHNGKNIPDGSCVHSFRRPALFLSVPQKRLPAKCSRIDFRLFA